MRIMDEATMERVAQYNIEYQKEHGVSPSYRNIMHALHLGSLATVQRYLNALEKSGRIERTRIGTIDPLPQLHTGKTTATPLLGRIACGEPTTEVEHIEESFALPQDLFGTGKLFMLHAHGDSMIEAGIDDGDLLVIREQNYADDGEIIVALVNGDKCGHHFRMDKWHTNRNGVTYGYKCYNILNNSTKKVRLKAGLSLEGYCDMGTIADWKMDMMAWHVFKNLKFSIRNIAEKADETYDVSCKTNQSFYAEEIATLNEKLAREKVKLENLTDMRVSGEISKEEYANAKYKINTSIIALEQRLDEIRSKTTNSEQASTQRFDPNDKVRNKLKHYNLLMSFCDPGSESYRKLQKEKDEWLKSLHLDENKILDIGSDYL